MKSIEYSPPGEGVEHILVVVLLRPVVTFCDLKSVALVLSTMLLGIEFSDVRAPPGS